MSARNGSSALVVSLVTAGNHLAAPATWSHRSTSPALPVVGGRWSESGNGISFLFWFFAFLLFLLWGPGAGFI
jgi:hypothetical protein